MATRSRIAVKLENGGYKSVYVHWDGSPDTRGPLLTECYPTLDAANALIAGGDMSSVGLTVDDSVYFARDRGESLNFDIQDSLTELMTRHGSDEEYIYIYEDETGWTVFDTETRQFSSLNTLVGASV
jgi:hypothetical protein